MFLTTDMRFRGRSLGAGSDSVGLLRPSNDAVEDRRELGRRMERDGYLYIPGLLNVDDVLEARGEVMKRLAASDLLEPGHPVMEGIARVGVSKMPPMTSLSRDNPSLHHLLYDGPMIDFYEFFLQGQVRHFDYTWLRAKLPGSEDATTPHCDIVYMGRGTKQLHTSWTPLGRVPLEMGGLMILEDSHKLTELRNTYGRTDVDLYCENEGDAAAVVEKALQDGRPLEQHERESIRWNSSGHYSEDAATARSELGGRWLSADFDLGDVVIFGMYTLHASSDNRSDRIRISSDSRYQLASEPADERWIGTDPPAHGIRAKRGMIC